MGAEMKDTYRFPILSLALSLPRSGSVPYKYHLAVNPIDGSDSLEGVYVSNYQTRQIIRIKEYSGLSKQALQSNYEVIAGTGSYGCCRCCSPLTLSRGNVFLVAVMRSLLSQTRERDLGLRESKRE